MVVVAIIAILATLSVSNFSTAIRRTRNTQRVSDINTVAKAMETCYDMTTARYTPATGGIAAATGIKVTGATDVAGPYKKSLNTCLNEDIYPGDASFPYSYTFVATTPQAYALCAKLEAVTGWESVGNSKNDVDNSKVIDRDPLTGNWTGTMDPCEEDLSGTCFFCVRSNQ